MSEKKKWEVTVAKSGVIEIEAASEDEVITILEKEPLSKLIQWEDSWNIADINLCAKE